jgi:hypothetical protein
MGLNLGGIMEMLMYGIVNSTFTKKIVLPIVGEYTFVVLINNCWHMLETCKE